jgi:hydroxymethylglutaryl-CoA lyase
MAMLSNKLEKVTIAEVGPRDGFQIEKQFIPTDKKIEIINALSRTGLKVIQVTSFVHPKAIPQLADSEEVMSRIDRLPGISYRVLAPNLKGVLRAIPLKPDKINLMMSVTESHNRANANRSIEESLKDFENFVPMILDAGISVVVEWDAPRLPFRRKEYLQQIERVVTGILLWELGVSASQIPLASKPAIGLRCRIHLKERYPEIHWHMHLHNNRDLALANILAAMQAGVTEFDAAIGGWAGVPMPPMQPRTSTEDLVNMLTEMGIETGQP